MIHLTPKSIGLPRKLLDIHERGELVFFTGAGISAPAGIKTFWPLVDQLWKQLIALPRSSSVSQDMNGGFLDRVVQHIDLNSICGRSGVRKLVAKEMENIRENALEYTVHKALLKLSGKTGRESRIVTTNYDRLFSDANIELGWGDTDTPQIFVPPALPVPKRDWAGHVYLHGKVEPSHIGQANDDLIISSGDFGRAYLTEQWAANFLRDLLANHSVCFIGYSLNDPILRYVTDAIAADNGAGESTREMFAFVGYDEAAGLPNGLKNEWEQKGVLPLLYPYQWTKEKEQNHSKLEQTIRAWATMATEVGYRENVIKGNVGFEPTLEGDTEASRLTRLILWAMDEPTGRVARTFAELEPCPTLEWLTVMAESKQTKYNLLAQSRLIKSKIRNSFIELSENATANLDNIQSALFGWIKRLLPQREMVVWLAQRGNVIQYNLEAAISKLLEAEDLDQDIRDGYALMLHGKLSNHEPFGHDHRSFEFMQATLPENFRIEQFYTELQYKFKVDIRMDKLVGRVVEQKESWNRIDGNLWKEESSASKFLHRATSVWVRNMELVSKFEQLSGVSAGIVWNLRSIGDMKKAKHDYGTLNRLLPLKNALVYLLETDQKSARSHINYWLELQYPELLKLAIWGTSYLEDLNPVNIINALSIIIDDQVIILDSSYRGEVTDLLVAKGKIISSDSALSDRFEALILDTPLNYSIEPSGEDKELFKNNDRYSRLQAAVDGGYVPGLKAKSFMDGLKSRYPDIDEKTRKYNSTPGATSSGLIGVPRSEHFDLEKPETWGDTLLKVPEDSNDNWHNAVTSDQELAFDALVLANDKVDSNLMNRRWYTWYYNWVPSSDKELLNSKMDRISILLDSDPDYFGSTVIAIFNNHMDALSLYHKSYNDLLLKIITHPRNPRELKPHAYQQRESNVRSGLRAMMSIISNDRSQVEIFLPTIKAALSFAYRSDDEHLINCIELYLLSRAHWVGYYLPLIYRSVVIPRFKRELEISESTLPNWGLSSKITTRLLIVLWGNLLQNRPALRDDQLTFLANTLVSLFEKEPKNSSLHQRIRALISHVGVELIDAFSFKFYGDALRDETKTTTCNVWKDRIEPFGRMCFPRTKVAHSAKTSAYLLSIAIENSGCFQEILETLWPYLVTLEFDYSRYSYAAIRRLEVGTIPEEEPILVKRILDTLYVAPAWKAHGSYIAVEQRVFKVIEKVTGISSSK